MKDKHKQCIVTIDGPAGSGKSTVARLLAERLGFEFLDTGAMYRAVAVICQRSGIDFEDQEGAAELAGSLQIDFPNQRVVADGIDVTEEIRQPVASHGSSIVAANPLVRKYMGELQRKAAVGASIVSEGRDQGTVVFPTAQCKFFLVADAEERAHRRQQELERTGLTIDGDEILQQIRDRDERDANREVAPLARQPTQ